MPVELDSLTGGDAWYYSNRAGVATVLDADTIRVIWDIDDNGTEDPGAMVADGIKSDSAIDAYLAARGIEGTAHAVDDLPAAKSWVASELAEASNYLTIYFGWIRRGLEEADFAARATRPAAGIGGKMSGFKALAEEKLNIIAGLLGETEGGFESVPVIDSSEQFITDENGNAIAPLEWWP
jgi:hypothetical protein